MGVEGADVGAAAGVVGVVGVVREDVVPVATAAVVLPTAAVLPAAATTAVPAEVGRLDVTQRGVPAAVAATIPTRYATILSLPKIMNKGMMLN